MVSTRYIWWARQSSGVADIIIAGGNVSATCYVVGGASAIGVTLAGANIPATCYVIGGSVVKGVIITGIPITAAICSVDAGSIPAITIVVGVPITAAICSVDLGFVAMGYAYTIPTYSRGEYGREGIERTAEVTVSRTGRDSMTREPIPVKRRVPQPIICRR